MSRNDYVTASELGEFTFCKRAWWLRRQGLAIPTQEMAQGSMLHDQQYSKVVQFIKLKRLFKLVFVVSLIVLIIVFIINFLLTS